QRLRHVRDPAPLLPRGPVGRDGRARGLRGPGPGLRGRRRRPGRLLGGHRALQQRPAGGQLHRRRRADRADRLRVLGQQRPLLRARQHRRGVRPGRRGARGSGDGVLRESPSWACGSGSFVHPRLSIRLDPVGRHPARDERAGLRFLGLGDGALRGGRGRLHEPGFRPPAGRGPGRGLTVSSEPVSSERGAPERFQVVIIGGGVIGTSVAYHLTTLGWTDVLLLEQGQLSCGTTWHAAGLVGQLRASEAGTRLVQYSTQLYERLERETGQATGFRRCGGVTVARTPERMAALERTAATATAYELDCELISPRRAAELYPIMATDDLVGAIWLPGDGRANPTDLTAALARGARQRGATIRERTKVTGILV